MILKKQKNQKKAKICKNKFHSTNHTGVWSTDVCYSKRKQKNITGLASGNGDNFSISFRNLANFFQEIKQELIRLGKICDLNLFALKWISKQQLHTQQKGDSMNFLCQKVFWKVGDHPANTGPFGRIRNPGVRRFHGRLSGSAIIGPGDSATRMLWAMGVKSARKWTELLFTRIIIFSGSTPPTR